VVPLQPQLQSVPPLNQHSHTNSSNLITSSLSSSPYDAASVDLQQLYESSKDAERDMLEELKYR
jgi:hypothetical protein